MARILSIDPGEHTGVAYLEDGHVVMAASFLTTTASLMEKMTDRLPFADVLLVEDSPRAGTRAQTNRVAWFVQWGQDTGFPVQRVIGPGLWKPALKTHKDLQYRESVQHIKDAANMAIWWSNFGRK